MSKIEKAVATDGSTVEFVNEVIGSGAVKDVYFSPDKSYVVAFYRNTVDERHLDRLKMITGSYRESLFNSEGGEYWKDLFCWPEKIVIWNGKVGITMPAYKPNFFFASGKMKGKEKEGKWFASAKTRKLKLMEEYWTANPGEKPEFGDWFSYLNVCLRIARAVRRLHAAGLAHSDLSYKNVLVDPKNGKACIIDVDELVVPQKYNPGVIGTPDFIAPEVLESQNLPPEHRKLPDMNTDKHALAVLIYLYLLYRHPLRGGKIYSTNPNEDENMSMGSRALFIEDSRNKSNRPNLADAHPNELPELDVDKMPYTICGPHLSSLFKKAFEDGLHVPSLRPTANAWEDAIVKTIDMLQPCMNEKCKAKWFVFDNSLKPKCPFCGTPYTKPLPVLDLYKRQSHGQYVPMGKRLMVYDKQCLYYWHVDSTIAPNEKVPLDKRRPVGDFQFFNGKWVLCNRRLTNMFDMTSGTKQPVPINSGVELTDGKKILFDDGETGILAFVSLVNK